MIRSGSVCAFVLTAFWGVSVSATMLVPADLGDLVVAAQVIAHAHVSTVEARPAPGARAVERVVTVQVERYFKGELGAEIRVRVPGGELGTYRTVMVGAPQFQPGDEVVLFLGQRPSALSHLVGLSQGVYRVVPGTGLGSRVVLPAVVAPSPGSDGPARLRRGDRWRRPMAFGEFAATLERLVKERSEEGAGQ